MIDFKELPQNGDDFEFLIRELLYNRGLEIYWSGKGADGGKDLICIEKQESNFKATSKRWVIQCKHNAHANRSVNTSDLEDIAGVCNEHNATGYLLACSTYPSSSLVKRLEEIQINKNITTCFWDSRYIEREIMKPGNWNLANMFFLNSMKKIGWRISTINPSFWHASYNGYIFYLAARLGTNYNHFLKDIEARLKELKKIELKKGHIVRLRAAYFDEKNTDYTLYIDYLVPITENEDTYFLDNTVNQFRKYDILDGVSYNFDIMTYRYSYGSDHFDKDHKDYYNNFLEMFQLGYPREGHRRYVYAYKESSFDFSEDIVTDDFNMLCDLLNDIDYIHILGKMNAKIEFIDQFSENFTWNKIMEESDYKVDNFFNVQIRFTCSDFNKLKKLIECIPQSVDKYFHLDKNYIFLPDSGFDEDECDIYTLFFSIHPALVTSKIQFRKFLNQYLKEVKTSIERYL